MNNKVLLIAGGGDMAAAKGSFEDGCEADRRRHACKQLQIKGDWPWLCFQQIPRA